MRARKLKELEHRIESDLPAEARARLRDLDPWERRRVVHGEIRDALRDQGRRCRSRLPTEPLSEIASAPRCDRPVLIHQLRRDHARLRARDVKRLGRDIGKPEAELEALEGLPTERLTALALDWNRERIDRVVADHGPPPGVSSREFEAWRELDHEEFYRRWRDLEPPPPFGYSARSGSRSGFSSHMRSVSEHLRNLRELSEPTWEDRIDLAGAPPDEREQALMARGRKRVLDYLERSGFASPEELEGLRACQGRAFGEALEAFHGEQAERAGLECSRGRPSHGGRRRSTPDG